MTLELKHFEIEELKTDDETRTIEGFAAVFNNVDNGNDIILPGAFTKTLKKSKPVMLWQHRTDMPIGVWDDLEETEKGLYGKGRIIDTALGLDAFKLIKGKAVKGLSIGYSTKKYEIDQNKGVRKLIEVELFEVSPVTFPMNDKAQITRVKGREMTIREFEEYLREGGFSQQDATTVALRGFKSLSTQGEPDQEVQQLTNLLNQFTA